MDDLETKFREAVAVENYGDFDPDEYAVNIAGHIVPTGAGREAAEEYAANERAVLRAVVRLCDARYQPRADVKPEASKPVLGEWKESGVGWVRESGLRWVGIYVVNKEGRWEWRVNDIASTALVCLDSGTAGSLRAATDAADEAARQWYTLPEDVKPDAPAYLNAFPRAPADGAARGRHCGQCDPVNSPTPPRQRFRPGIDEIPDDVLEQIAHAGAIGAGRNTPGCGFCSVCYRDAIYAIGVLRSPTYWNPPSFVRAARWAARLLGVEVK